mmetsp:Transcript_12788/g.33988  ORF Transcript_12788/g.33988 Transcript_12788/m.33988 type:complete len:201 (-) Transcript_12788:47-649(-)
MARDMRSLAVNMRVSRTVRFVRSTSSCSTNPMRWRTALVSRSPLYRTDPDTVIFAMLCILPPITLSSVVFPDPEGPMSASSFPLSTRPETLLSRRRTLLLLVVLVSAAAVVAAASPASLPEAEAEAEAEGGATPRRRVFFLDDEEEEEEDDDTLRATQTCVNVQSRPAPPSPPPPPAAAPPADSPFWADEADMEIVKCEV